MAGTSFDPTTLDEWVLLRDICALVMQLGKPERDTAEAMIIDYINQRSRPRPLVYKCLWPDGTTGISGANPLREIHPILWGFSNRAMGEYCVVDFDNSTVTNMRFPPAMEHGTDVGVVLKIQRKYSRGGQELSPPIGSPHQLRLVRLHRDVVIDMLRSFGFSPAKPVKPAVKGKMPKSTTSKRTSKGVRLIIQTAKNWPWKPGIESYARYLCDKEPRLLRIFKFHTVQSRVSDLNLIPNSKPRDRS